MDDYLNWGLVFKWHFQGLSSVVIQLLAGIDWGSIVTKDEQTSARGGERFLKTAIPTTNYPGKYKKEAIPINFRMSFHISQWHAFLLENSSSWNKGTVTFKIKTRHGHAVVLFRFVCIFVVVAWKDVCVCVAGPGPRSPSRRRLGSVETAVSLGLAGLACQCCDRGQGRWSGKQSTEFVYVVPAVQNSWSI